MRVALFASLALMAACVAGPPDSHRPPVAEGEEFQLSIGESVGVEGGVFIIEFSKVLEDSRCPMNARCIWEGNARIALKLREYTRGQAPETLDVGEDTLELNTSERFPTRGTFGTFGESSKGISIQLLRLEPIPMAGVQTRDFVVTLLIEAGK